MAGPGWTCPGTAANNCGRNDALSGGASYPPIKVAVNVAWNASSPQVNTVGLSGGGSAPASATDPTAITPNPPVLSIAMTHTGRSTEGQHNATYQVALSNAAGAGSTTGTLVVTDTVPSGM